MLNKQIFPKKLSIIIPVFNEENTIQVVLERLLNLPLNNIEIIVVDDKSTDKTREKIKEFLSYYKNSATKIKSIYLSKNQGKSKAIQSALMVATGKYTIIQDADLEYNPQDIVRMFKLIKKNKLVALYGSRFLNKKIPDNMGLKYWFANKIITLLTNFLYKTQLTDQNTCYKMIKTQILQNLQLQTKNFEFCAEVTAKLRKQYYPIAEIPINYKARNKKDGKKIRWFHIFSIIKTLLMERL